MIWIDVGECVRTFNPAHATCGVGMSAESIADWNETLLRKQVTRQLVLFLRAVRLLLRRCLCGNNAYSQYWSRCGAAL